MGMALQDIYDKQDTTYMVKDQVLHVKGYIKRFQNGILERLEQTDLSHAPNSYSEAPAEGLFSVLERVLNGRESLSLDCAEALTRISLEGPGVATMEGLSKKALQLW